jgi:hypothetical protein
MRRNDTASKRGVIRSQYVTNQAVKPSLIFLFYFAGLRGLIGRLLYIRVGEFALRRTQPIFRRVTVREVDAEP